MSDLNITTAFTAPENMRLHHATAAAAEKLASMLVAEYPALTLSVSESAETGKPIWAVSHTAPEEGGEVTEVYMGPKVPTLALLLDSCEDLELDPEATPEAEDDEPKLSGSVVPDHYRQQYRAASSNGQTCGDWLAEWLTIQTHGAEGFMVADFTAILQLNDIDLNTKWGRLPESGQKGWVGRYRMNGRQVMEKAVAKRGWAVGLTGEKDTAPEAFLTALRGKHEKWLAKDAKAEAAATAAIKEAVEGTVDEDMGPLYPTEVDEGDNA